MKLGYTILYVENVLATVEFYERALGLKRRFIAGSDYAEMETGGTRLAFARRGFVEPMIGLQAGATGREQPPAPMEIGLVADDVEASYRHAVSQGAVPVKPPTVKPWGQTVSYVRDPDGFLVEICSAVA